MSRVAFGVIALLAYALPAVAGEGDAQCLKCHADRAKLLAARKDASRPLEALLIDRARYDRSVHASRGCGECHFDYDEHPHGKDAETARCADCHEDQATELAASVHGRAREGKEKLPVGCGACHGVHDVLKPTDRDAQLHPLNVYRVCGQCHFDVDPAQATVKELLKEKYTDDTHAHGILQSGLVVSATCVSCHGGHGIRAQDDPKSRVARQNVDRVCGTCHLGAFEHYRRSVHHLRSHGAEHKGATCSDCHQHHEIQKASDLFRTEAVRACSKCHNERGGSFRQSYHGKVTTLGYRGKVATCEACHGHHEILPSQDPASLIHPKNRVTTCGQCHEDSHPEFAAYLVHADPRDGENYPQIHLVYVFMNSLLIGVLVLGGLHALLWLIRATAAGEWKRPALPRELRRYFRRWPRSYVTYHVVLMWTVLVLASTGLPLHFSDKEWSLALMGVFGGPMVTGYVHRSAAVVLGALFLVYAGHLAWRLVVRREKEVFASQNTMLPRWKDLQDLVGNLRWFLFLAPRPRYDRWTYWEKFDFWAAFWGLFVIGITGLMLWFPEQATRFVPAWFINAAVVIHGIEALLDIAFIFTVHVFHANLRPDKFPMDTAFWTGRITEQEFHHERPLEYERAVREGRLEALLDRPPAQRTRRVAYIIGGCALGVGFFFVAMMIVAVIQNAG
ncbi:MAG: cytochrome b/b6 domain-containing protein [Planctomycetota bacterium]|jgi:cytochrome b subunit of formate dehydrogenase